MTPQHRTTDPTARLLKGHDDQERRPMHVVLCSHSYKVLQDLADSHGATVTGLIDALAHALERPSQPDAPERLELIARVARTIDVERRRKRYEDGTTNGPGTL